MNVAIFRADERLDLAIIIDIFDTSCLDVVPRLIGPEGLSMPTIRINRCSQACNDDFRLVPLARYICPDNPYSFFCRDCSDRNLQVAAVDRELFILRTDDNLRSTMPDRCRNADTRHQRI